MKTHDRNYWRQLATSDAAMNDDLTTTIMKRYVVTPSTVISTASCNLFLSIYTSLILTLRLSA